MTKLDSSTLSMCVLDTHYRCTFTLRIFEAMKKEKELVSLNSQVRFDAVAFFRAVKEKMAQATENMTLPEKRNYWQLMREGKIALA